MAKKIIDGETVRHVAHGTIKIEGNPAEAQTPPPSPTPPKRAARNEAAKTTEEFIEKYKGKRFTAKDAGKVYFLNFLLSAYSKNVQEIDIDTKLWDVNKLLVKMENPEDVAKFSAYLTLVEYFRTEFEQALSIRKSLDLYIASFQTEATTAMSGEYLRNSIQGEQTEEAVLWLNTLTIEAYSPQKTGGILVQSLREHIEQNIRYLKAYHTFIDELADFTKIPECEVLKVKTTLTEKRLSVLNDCLSNIRDNVKAHREPEIKEAAGEHKIIPLSLILWTPEYLEATMRNFQPIEEAPPVPEERLKYLRDTLRRDFKLSIINWYTLFHDFSINYRVPYPAVTPPISPTDPEDIIEMTVEVAEADK